MIDYCKWWVIAIFDLTLKSRYCNSIVDILSFVINSTSEKFGNLDLAVVKSSMI